MRAIVLLCLLHAAFSKQLYTWPGKHDSPDYACLKDQPSCGCCLMQKKMMRMESFFNQTYEAITKYLAKPKMALDDMMTNRSAFSVGLNHTEMMSCFGPFPVIKYNNVFLNLGDGYNTDTGIFTVPRCGVYSLAVTVYSSSITSLMACGNLLVNGQMVASVIERKGQDDEDSATVVVSVKLKTGDEVKVNLPEGCAICDDHNNFNTFTGFLLYSDVEYRRM
ncbi:complement C1q-like protein 2 [Sebastes umbrosus]|uniref:complement C1q-like protein 2 n=1 Tax=Sebastes umbrosus TaxID=72105 RepID=UPI0018A011AE|nr:complement C1q-like protein 2 [Sebastes umbrosus]